MQRSNKLYEVSIIHRVRNHLNKPLGCDNKKCGSERFTEIFDLCVTVWVPNSTSLQIS